MAYRNGTYIAFHAEGTNVPTETDFKYYNLIKAWAEKEDDDFSFVNSHEKTHAVRDTSMKATLQNRLKERLRESKNMLLIIGAKTRFDTDWVPFEISYAVDHCGLPIIAVYPTIDGNRIIDPSALRYLWPRAFADRIDSGHVHAIHIPYRKAAIKAAIDQFHLNNMPGWPLTYYLPETYASWGL
jgi:antiphage defense system Thoeris ThsB-like protein